MTGDHVTAFLSGIRVVEVGGGVVGSAAASLLAGLGADVATTGPTGGRVGPVLRGRSRSVPAIDAVLDRRKRFVTTQGALSLARDADIVVVDGVDPTEIRRQVGDGPVVVSITPFGLDGPRAGDAGGELVAQAAGGLLSTIEDGAGTPVPAPGHVAQRTAGAQAALAALHGLDRRAAGGHAVSVDLSVQEAVVATAFLPECAHRIFACPGRAGSGRYLAPSGLFRAADGLVRITAIENHQWRGLVAALGDPDWAHGLDERQSRIDHADLINDRVTAWAGDRPKSDCARVLQAHGVPSTAVNLPGELVSSEQFRHRGAVIDTELEGAPAVVIGEPWVVHAGGSAPARRSGRLADIRIAELTHVLAGPIVGTLLGAMGATSVRVEDPDRLDIYRRTGPFARGIAGTERGAYFAVANHSKRSVQIDSEHAVAEVAALIDQSDVVIENVGSSRLTRLGVDPDALAAAGTVTLRVSGFGTDGPMAGNRVYANNVQAYGGLAGSTLASDGSPARLGTVIADPLSSVMGALVVAAWALGPARTTGAVIDLSMAEVVASLVGEYVAAGSSTHPTGTDPDVLRGVYRCRDDRFAAVELLDLDERRRCAELLGDPADDLSATLARAAEGEDAQVFARRLADAGVRAAAVVAADDLLADKHLAARGFFPGYDHPDPDITDARLVGLPWRFVGEPAIPLGPPPTLGEANALYERTVRVR
ncbi:CoA transferase [uncultured Williamsia sp.]|uniref:CoA transferase n=1 Tax=uncultured Williamsia sp. TaxID=259311 RepID=UPI00260E985B|nr:CoA transferase [uncultured Williamsia sp.]